MRRPLLNPADTAAFLRDLAKRIAASQAPTPTDVEMLREAADFIESTEWDAIEREELEDLP